VSAFNPREWAPFHEAHAQIKARVGSGEVADHDLIADLAHERLQAVYRHFVGGYESLGCFLPAFWQHRALRVRADGHIDWRSVGDWFDYMHLRNLHIFVRRAELDQLYPRTLDHEQSIAAAIPAPVEPPPTRRRGRGWTHEWHLIDGQIAALCINPATGRLLVPDKDSAIVDDVRKWLLDNNKAVPSDSQRFEAVSQVCAPLRELERKLRRRPARR
jgi:hypothetical protein